MDITIVLVIIAGALLILHWKGPNAVWGGATFGIIVGIIISLINKDWGLLTFSFAVGTIAGAVFEWIGRIATKLRKPYDK